MNHSPLPPVEDDAIVLRPIGIGRYIEAAFLGIWLTFWSIFEVFVVSVLGSMLFALFGFLRDSRLTSLGRAAVERAPGFEVGILVVYLFLIAWFGLWTVAGLAAGYRFLRLVGGSDRLAIAGDELHLSWRAGPVRRSRRFERGAVRRVRVRRHDKAVVADVESGTTTLTDLGSVAEREAIAAWLRVRLGLDGQRPPPFDPLVAPTGWRVVRGDSGALHLTRPSGGRRAVAMIMGAATGIGAFAAAVDISNHGLQSTAAILVLALLALAAAWIAWAREEWLARPGQLDYRFKFGPFVKQRTYNDAELHIDCTVDSDGDAKYKLRIANATTKRTIASAMYDDTELSDTARWLESVTGFRVVM